MTYSYTITLLIVCPMIFLAGFVDSIAGGGGLISLPAYILAGLPVHTAYGTNKFASCFGTGVSVFNYSRKRRVHFPAAFAGVAGALPGSWLGTELALYLPAKTLLIIMMIILPLVAVFVLLNKGMKGEALGEPPIKKLLVISFFTGLVFGAYDGFFGPGTGMFITLVLTGLAHMELIKAAGTTRVLNFASNLASMIVWLTGGKILFALAVPAMICSVAGNFIGSRLAIKNGKKIIRPIILVVAGLLFIKVISDLAGFAF
ncbi:MAG: TSUP family transporter [Treponema sp.]|nr:TSUP family transporter [Treponema sp.]